MASAKKAVLDAAEKTIDTTKKTAEKVDTKAALDSIEKTLDVIEEQIETVERIPRLRLNGTTRKQQIVILATTALAGVVVGGAATYFVVSKRLKTKYETILETELEYMRVYYARINKKEEFATPEATVEQLNSQTVAEQILADNEYVSTAERPVKTEAELITKADPEKPFVDYGQLPEKSRVLDEVEVIDASLTLDGLGVVEVVEPVVQNVWDNQVPVEDDDWDQEAEEAYRKPLHEDTPYIISETEYLTGELEYEQVNLTYYAEDDTLADAQDQPLEKPDEIVGDDNLRFGHGSNNKNIVYIRNNRLEVDLEVHRSEGSFVKEVLGLETEDELKHSDSRRIRRFRGFDE